YIGVPEGHPLAAAESYEDLPLRVHGGLTYASHGGKEWPKGWYWWGWDYCHAGDRMMYDSAVAGIVSLGRESDHAWTPEEVLADAHDALYDFRKLVRVAERISSAATGQKKQS